MIGNLSTERRNGHSLPATTDASNYWLQRLRSIELHPLVPTEMRIVYTALQVPENIIRHQLDVAAVAQTIIARSNLSQPVDAGQLLAAALCHDLRNLIKVKPENMFGELQHASEFWLFMQQAMIRVWGEHEHRATESTVLALGLGEEVEQLIRSMEPVRGMNRFGSLAERILLYADDCVSPDGIVSYDQRMADVCARYNIDPNLPGMLARKENARLVESMIVGGPDVLLEIDARVTRQKLLQKKVPVQLFAPAFTDVKFMGNPGPSAR